jgi:hypothetical protein
VSADCARAGTGEKTRLMRYRGLLSRGTDRHSTDRHSTDRHSTDRHSTDRHSVRTDEHYSTALGLRSSPVRVRPSFSSPVRVRPSFALIRALGLRTSKPISSLSYRALFRCLFDSYQLRLLVLQAMRGVTCVGPPSPARRCHEQSKNNRPSTVGPLAKHPLASQENEIKVEPLLSLPYCCPLKKFASLKTILETSAKIPFAAPTYKSKHCLQALNRKQSAASQLGPDTSQSSPGILRR